MIVLNKIGIINRRAYQQESQNVKDIPIFFLHHFFIPCQLNNLRPSPIPNRDVRFGPLTIRRNHFLVCVFKDFNNNDGLILLDLLSFDVLYTLQILPDCFQSGILICQGGRSLEFV